jgi:Domain of unknown function (DUF4138)
MKMTKKTTILIIILLINLITYSQQIEVNNTKIITVIFTSNVIKAVCGNSTYKVEYNKDGSEQILFIKSSPTLDESNLIVKTNDNRLYNLSLKFTKKIPNEKNNVKIEESLGIILKGETVPIQEIKETKKIEETKPIITDEKITKKSIRENDYTIGDSVINDSEIKIFESGECEYILKKGKQVNRITTSNFKIKIDLESVYYKNNELYISISILNNSNIDFVINYIKTYLKQEKENKTSSSQYLEINPLKIYNSKGTIVRNKENKFIFIYSQFTIDDNKNLVFELNESNGERNLKLEIPNQIINNPKTLKN